MRRQLAALTACTLTLAACTSKHHASTPSTVPGAAIGSNPAAVTQLNPVLLLKRSGCTDGLTTGQPAIMNVSPSWYAYCGWGPNVLGGSQTLTVWAYASNADRDADMAAMTVQADTTVITGDKFIGELEAACCGEADHVTASVVAARIGGRVA